MSSPHVPLPRRPRQRPSLAHVVVERLSVHILAGHYLAGEKMPCETQIMREHGVSRAVVREAIGQLQMRGLVDTRHGVGSFITAGAHRSACLNAPLRSDMLSLIEVRISVEVEAAGLAAQRASPAQLQALQRILEALADPATEPAGAARLDYQFHHLIAQATGNRYFVQFVEYLEDTLIPRTRVDTSALAALSRSDYNALIQDEHESILGAIASGDGTGARAAMRLHLIHVRDRFKGPTSPLA